MLACGCQCAIWGSWAWLRKVIISEWWCLNLPFLAPVSSPVLLLPASAPLSFPSIVFVLGARELEEPGLVPPLVSAVSDLQSPSGGWCLGSLSYLRRCSACRFCVEVLDWKLLVKEAGQLPKTLLRAGQPALGGPA